MKAAAEAANTEPPHSWTTAGVYVCIARESSGKEPVREVSLIGTPQQEAMVGWSKTDKFLAVVPEARFVVPEALPEAEAAAAAAATEEGTGSGVGAGAGAGTGAGAGSADAAASIAEVQEQAALENPVNTMQLCWDFDRKKGVAAEGAEEEAATDNRPYLMDVCVCEEDNVPEGYTALQPALLGGAFTSWGCWFFCDLFLLLFAVVFLWMDR